MYLAMDCYSDFFSLLSLAQLNNSASLTTLQAAPSPPNPHLVGVSHSASTVHTGHRLPNSPAQVSNSTPLLSEMSTAASRSHGTVHGPVLVASQCSDVDMMMDTVSCPSAINAAPVLSTCRQFSGLKRKREGHLCVGLGDNVDIGSGAEWAAVPPATATTNGHRDDVLNVVDIDLQPDKQKRICSEHHRSLPYPHHHPFTTPSGHNGLTHISPPMLNNASISNHSDFMTHLLPSSIDSNSFASDHSLGVTGYQPSSKNTFANQKLNLCTAGTSVLGEEAGSCMHIHVPGVSVTECPRCLAGEPVYTANTGTYGTLQSIFEPQDGYQLNGTAGFLNTSTNTVHVSTVNYNSGLHLNNATMF